MEFNLTKQQRLTARAAATERSRPVLTAVHIRKGIIEATDGCILVQKKIDYDGDQEVMLSAKDVNKIADCKQTETTRFCTTPDGKIKSLGKDDIIHTPIEGSFPELNGFYPAKEPVFKIALDRNVLKKAIDALDKEERHIKFYFYGSHEPVKFVVGDTTGLMMPLYINDL